MRSELFWLAFRYVSGELAPGEAEAFERRLDNDQEARESVAEAVELSAGVAALPGAFPAVIPLRPFPTFRDMAAVAAALAACMLALVGLYGWFLHPDDPTSASRKAASARRVALIWSGLREQADADANGGKDLLTWLDESSQAPEPQVLASSDASEVSDNMPGWLWEAVSLPRSEGPAASEPQEN